MIKVGILFITNMRIKETIISNSIIRDKNEETWSVVAPEYNTLAPIVNPVADFNGAITIQLISYLSPLTTHL